MAKKSVSLSVGRGKKLSTKEGAGLTAKRERIKAGSGEKMNKVGSKNAPTAKDFKQSAKTAKGKK